MNKDNFSVQFDNDDHYVSPTRNKSVDPQTQANVSKDGSENDTGRVDIMVPYVSDFKSKDKAPKVSSLDQKIKRSGLFSPCPQKSTQPNPYEDIYQNIE